MSSSNSVSFKITIDDEFKSQIFEKISPEFRVSVQGQLVPFATRIELDLSTLCSVELDQLQNEFQQLSQFQNYNRR